MTWCKLVLGLLVLLALLTQIPVTDHRSHGIDFSATTVTHGFHFQSEFSYWNTKRKNVRNWMRHGKTEELRFLITEILITGSEEDTS